MTPPRLALALAALLPRAHGDTAWSMQPVTSLQARVETFAPVWNQEHEVWVSGHPSATTFEEQYAATLDSVTTSSVEGALMYLQRDCIDIGAAPWASPGGCSRVNNVSVITFLEVQIANPNAALAEYQSDRYTYPEFCPFVEMKKGQCIYTNTTGTPTVVIENPVECKQYYGLDGQPNIGPCVGAEAFPTDNIAPYFDTVWFSYPNSCVMKQWGNGKDETCRSKYTGGLCPFGKTPDGVTCQFSYKILGYINIDELVGITAMSVANSTASSDADDIGAESTKNILANPGEDSVAGDDDRSDGSGSSGSNDDDDDGMVAEDGTKFGTWKCNSRNCFQDFQQFCQANNTEFHSTDKDRTLGLSAVQSISFWGYPSDHRVNKNRTAFMIHTYNKQARKSAKSSTPMTPLPVDLTDLTKKNPPCYENAQKCYDAHYGCMRHSYAQVCTVCREMGEKCVVRNPSYIFPTLTKVPRQVPDSKLRSKSVKLANAKATSSPASALHVSLGLSFTILVVVVTAFLVVWC